MFTFQVLQNLAQFFPVVPLLDKFLETAFVDSVVLALAARLRLFPVGLDELLLLESVHSQTHLNKIARRLNERPRETLGFKTPAYKFNECVASID